MSFFLKMMYSHSDETDILDVLEIKTFAEIFLKLFLWILHLVVVLL